MVIQKKSSSNDMAMHSMYTHKLVSAGRADFARFNSYLFTLHFVAMYLELSIYVDNRIFFPYAGATIIALIGAVFNFSQIRSRDIFSIFIIIFMIAASSGISALGGYYSMYEFLPSFSQILVSIFSAYFMFIVLINSDLKRTSNFLIALLFFVIAGSFAEKIPQFQSLSDDFRRLIYPENLLYFSESRDIESYGAIRPRLFTREPSLVGIAAGILITMIFLLSKKGTIYRIIIALFSTLACAYVTRSPTLIIFWIIVVYGSIALRPDKLGHRSWLVGLAMAFTIVFLSFSLTFGGGLSRIDNDSILGGGSYILRIFGPPLIWLESLKQDPFFGLGLGSFDVLLPIAQRAYADFEILSFFPHLRDVDDGAFLISNALWEFLIFFGLLGSLLTIISLIRLFWILGVARLSFPFFAAFLAFQTFGGISAYRPWHILFVFAAIALIKERDFASARHSRRPPHLRAAS
jgi:hypothetical protein